MGSWPFGTTLQWVRLSDAKNNTCASACFFLYVAGVRRLGSVVGVHRPSLSPEEYAAISLDQAAQSHLWIKDQIAEYLEEMDVPQKYVDTIMSAHSGEIVWLSKEDMARDFDGLIRQYDEWFRANCPTLTEFQKSEDERLRQRFVRGQQLTPAELEFRANVDRIIEAEVDCTTEKLEETQERNRETITETLLGGVER